MRKIKADASPHEGKAEKQPNRHSGTSFDDFLRDEGIFDETHARASKRARSEQIEDSLQRE